jgi:uncharacterized protein
MKRHILTLDGGGVRGALTAGLLIQAERVLAGPDRPDFRLSDHFHLIAGTSTGAIIAAGLALGYSAAEIAALYRDLGPRVFRQARWTQGLRAKFDVRGLDGVLSEHLGERTLASADLRTGLLVCAKRIDTASPWLISNTPRSRYWNGDPDDPSVFPNRDLLLKHLVRASAAAPFYFDALTLPIGPGQTGVFVDGAVSPYNNPALAAFMVATLPPYGWCWPTGPDRLHLLSLGTGSIRPRITPERYRSLPAAGQAITAITSLIHDTSQLAITLLQSLSDPVAPVTLNGELGDLSGIRLTPEPLLSFERIDIALDGTDAIGALGIDVSAQELRRLQALDDPGCIERLIEIGMAMGQRMVTPATLGVQSAG